MVVFEVGPTKEKFFIHKEIACNGSPVFDKAFNGSFEEAATQAYTLEDVDANTFRFFSEWLYSQRLSLLDHNFDDKEKEAWTVSEKKTHNKHCMNQDIWLVELWILGDRFLVNGLQNAVMDNMVKISKICGLMRHSCFEIIYSGTPKHSPLRSFVVQNCVWKRKQAFSEDPKWFPAEMRMEMLDVFQEAAPQAVKNRKSEAIVAEDFFVADM